MNAVDLRLRLSLYARILVALGVLASFSFALAIVIGFFGGILLVGFGALTLRGLEVVAAFPRVSTVTPVPAVLVAVAAVVGVVALLRGWSFVVRHTAAEYVFPPDCPASAASTCWLLGCCYLLVVEGSAAAAVALSMALSSLWGFVLVLLAGALISVVATVSEVRKEVRSLRQQFVDDSAPADDDYPGLVATTRQLAQLADVSEPDVYVTDADRPESFTVGAGRSAVVVVSTGLVDALSLDELEAVLAHEISHLANGDSRVMAAALVPVLVSDDWIEGDSLDLGDLMLDVFFAATKLYGQFGVAVLSRGREWGADAGAVALTGSPAALASALERLDERRRRPSTDLRDWEQSVAAIDVLPPSSGEAGAGPFRTHPSTSERIDRLGRLAAQAEER